MPAAPPAIASWPYPQWIAHRGAGLLAPENTLAAMRLGAQHGFAMAECDVKLSADEQAFLLHDDRLERTSNGHGLAGDQTWATLAQLDAGRWLSPAYAGERLATLDELARFCLATGHAINLEIKPSPGTERRTGEVVASRAQRLWAGAAPPPLLTSFSIQALEGARASAPELPRGLLLEQLEAGWLERALALGCVAVVCHHPLWGVASAGQAKRAGLRLLSYTVNDALTARRLLDLGVDSLITDQLDLPQLVARGA